MVCEADIDAENPNRMPWPPPHLSPVSVRGTNDGKDGNSTSGDGTTIATAVALGNDGGGGGGGATFLYHV